MRLNLIDNRFHWHSIYIVYDRVKKRPQYDG